MLFESGLRGFGFLNLNTFDGDIDSYVHGSTTHLIVSSDTDMQVSLFRFISCSFLSTYSKRRILFYPWHLCSHSIFIQKH